ncbi:MAG TPA: delta-60 repeat domain-containing protein, partial [Tepidisphaeraceae bacterium]
MKRCCTGGWVERLEARRLLSAGELDATFGAGGKVVLNMAGASLPVAAVQADGKTVLAGKTSTNKLVVVRLNRDGSLDQGFGAGGMVYSSRLGNGLPRVLIDRLNERIYAYDGSTILAFGDKGTLDKSFSGDGVLAAPEYGAVPRSALAVAPDGSLLFAYTRWEEREGAQTIALRRYGADGKLDLTFGRAGVTALPTEKTDSWGPAESIAIDHSGSIFVEGDRNRYRQIMRLSSNGIIDANFGFASGSLLFDATNWRRSIMTGVDDQGAVMVVSGGLVRWTRSGQRQVLFDQAGAMAAPLQPDGKPIMVFGRNYSGTRVVKGHPDPQFHDVKWDVYGESEGVAMSAEGSLILAGTDVLTDRESA